MDYIFADLHIHSKFSQATSEKMDFENLARYGIIKGLDIIGTGDFTHPAWLNEIKTKLDEIDETGTFIHKDKNFGDVYFTMTGEVNNIFDFEGSKKQIHNVIFTPNLEIASQINDELSKFGNLESDARPDLHLPPAELVEIVLGISKDNEVIPAHIWTSWFGVLGARGFDSLKDCYQDQLKNIHALETGLSSDPQMNWRLSSLDNYTLISNSDCHSPWVHRLGREANVFDLDLENLTYFKIVEAVRKKDLVMTIEVDPSYGKYHFTGHRKGKKGHEHSSVCLSPKESMKLGNKCPVCGKKMTIGVLQRVKELADREEDFLPENSIPFKRLIPLTEIISSTIGIKSPFSKTVWAEYLKMVNKFGNEYKIMLEIPEEEMLEISSKEIVDAILKVRKGDIIVLPGFDGEYGRPIFREIEDSEEHIDSLEEVDKLEKEKIKQKKKGQLQLNDFT